MTPEPERAEMVLSEAINFIQQVAASRNAVCKADHHAGTCRGAVGLAEEALRVLASLGIEPHNPLHSVTEPCPACGDGSYVIGQVWLRVWVHDECLKKMKRDLVVKP